MKSIANTEDIANNNCYYRGEVLRVNIPESQHLQKKIQKQRNVLKSQNIDTVIILGTDEDGFYTAIPCNTKRKKCAVPVRIGWLSFFAQIKPILHIDAGVLRRFADSELHDKEQVLKKIEENIGRRIELREHKKDRRRTLAEQQKKDDLRDRSILKNHIRYKSDNVVCPVCKKLLPTGYECVYISGEGMPLLRVGLCVKCKTYYSFSSKLIHKKGECDGLPVVWSNLRYQSGTGEKVYYKEIKLRTTDSSANTLEKGKEKNRTTLTEDTLQKGKKQHPSSEYYGILLKQLPVIGVHDKDCPICHRSPDKLSKIAYLVYDRRGNDRVRYGYARQCSLCDIVFLDSGFRQGLGDQNGEYRIFTFDATQCANAKSLIEMAEKEPHTNATISNPIKLPFDFAKTDIPNLSTESKVVSVYSRKCHCKQCRDKYGINTIKNRTAVVWTVVGDVIEVTVMFCVGCGKYYMNYTSFEMYRKNYGGLLLEYRLTGDLVKNANTTCNFAQDSILSRCGYTVRQGVSREYRQAILKYILDSRKASKCEIVELISGFIDLRDYNPKYDAACVRWREDIFFVNQYQQQIQKKVYGLTFVQGK